MLKHVEASSSLPAAALAVALALALVGCGEEAGEPQGGDDPTPETTSAQPTESPAQETETETEVQGATLTVTVSGDDVSPVGETIEMSAGDALTVRVTSDRAGELHVHSSPEQYVEFGRGTTRQQVTIDKPGQVDLEEHDSGALVARLLVQ